VALVGPSGAGKTTIFQLLQRFYDPDVGAHHAGWRAPDATWTATPSAAHIALVPQDPVIFAASARDNIRFGRPDA
jgi:ATP-binding cassette subfamily B protein